MESEHILDYMKSDIYKPLTVQELSEVFGETSASEFRDLVKTLTELEDNGEVVRSKNNRYGLPDAMNLVVGKLQMKARGFGFVISEQTDESDVYIPATEMNGAMSGDKVLAKVTGDGRGGPHREGVIVRVVERANNRVVGKITIFQNHAFVEPTDKRFQEDIFVDKNETLDAHDGYIVVAEITGYPSESHGPRGRVVEVLGHPDTPGIDILSVIRKYGLPEEFQDKVLQAAEAIPIEIDAAESAKRRDLRDEVIVTIDGEDAKDLDDAVHVKELENGNYLLGVHIADVGYYVKEGGTIDQEAFRRGTSVYLVDRVIPMLPQRLSNNICSLNPRVDRLTMSCEMEISPDGVVVSHEIFPSIIKTTARMTYNNVRKILVENDPEVIAEYESLVPMFQRMEKLALILRDRRMNRGAIDFEFDEIYVKVDDLGHPTDIVPRKRSIAEKLIEEFMLAANETVAEHFHWLGVPFVYRVHDEPEADKMFDLNAFLHNFGHSLKGVGGSKIHPRALQSVLRAVEGSREARMISTVMLRSMQQAKYKPECTGHFGLAAEYYTHFTSPIRRYPDLTIHRIMREVLTGQLSDERDHALRDFVEEASRQSSERERLAQDAEREVDQLKMVEYMQDHVGEEFDGIISSVTSFGCFVQLDNGVEGLMHISSLDDDYYVFNDKQMALIGERNRRVFRMGDPVRIEVARASKEDLQIDFSLVLHHREATFVTDGRRGGEIVYDEDLSPKDRNKSERRREEMSSAAPRRGRISGRGRNGRIEQGDKRSDGTISGGYAKSGRSRDAEHLAQRDSHRDDYRGATMSEDMPFDEWDADFPDPREARAQANAERAEKTERNQQGRTERSQRSERFGRSDRGERRTGQGRPSASRDGRRRRSDTDGRGPSRYGESNGGRNRRSGEGAGGGDSRDGRRRDAGYEGSGRRREGSGEERRGDRGGRRDGAREYGRSGGTRGESRDSRQATGRSEDRRSGTRATRDDSRDGRDARDNRDARQSGSERREGGRSRTGGYRTWAGRDGDGGSAADRRFSGDGGKPRKKHKGSVKAGAKVAAKKRSSGRGTASSRAGAGRSKGRG